VLADHVYKDVFSGKMVIAGTFNRLCVGKSAPEEKESPSQHAENAAQQPGGPRKLKAHEISRVGSTAAYISLTEVRGTVPLELRYVDLADNRTVLRVEFAVRSDDPLSTVEAIIPIPPMLAPHVGAFALELLSGNEPLGSHRVTVSALPPSGEGQERGASG
jgi:hypothetical protein